jgi:hypothetical protein
MIRPPRLLGPRSRHFTPLSCGTFLSVSSSICRVCASASRKAPAGIDPSGLARCAHIHSCGIEGLSVSPAGWAGIELPEIDNRPIISVKAVPPASTPAKRNRNRLDRINRIEHTPGTSSGRHRRRSIRTRLSIHARAG